MHTELMKAKLFEQSEAYQTLKSGDIAKDMMEKHLPKGNTDICYDGKKS